jgi:hypothetical protein
MRVEVRLARLADWLRDYDYEISGPDNDDRVVVITVDSQGGVHLTAPPDKD